MTEMARPPATSVPGDLLVRTARYCQNYRTRKHPIDPAVSVNDLRAGLCRPLPLDGLPAADVIDDLIRAAEPGLVGSTDPNFFAWVIGASDPVGVAADWLTSTWGQNAAIYQSAPAAAIAEEAVSGWLLDLLDLPDDSSVGFVSGASMATFVGLAAARDTCLRRRGYDLETHGLQGAPLVHVFLSADAHVANYAALRHLGFGEANFHRMPADASGLMRAEDLNQAMVACQGPKIVIAQAGHIHSGGFEPLDEIARVTRAHDGWLHIDGAFGLWARASRSKRHLARGAELADSWSVDGHKWLQLPYSSGFAIVRDKDAHRRAMSMNAGYLNMAQDDGRSPSDFVPELSRRAQGFAAWAVLRHHGRTGVEDMVDRHCAAASLLAARLDGIDGLTVLNRVDLNQVIVGCTDQADGDSRILALAERLRAGQRSFVRIAHWNGRLCLRFSVISKDTARHHVTALADEVAAAWGEPLPETVRQAENHS